MHLILAWQMNRGALSEHLIWRRYTDEEELKLLKDCLASRRESTLRAYGLYQGQFRVCCRGKL